MKLARFLILTVVISLPISNLADLRAEETTYWRSLAAFFGFSGSSAPFQTRGRGLAIDMGRLRVVDSDGDSDSKEMIEPQRYQFTTPVFVGDHAFVVIFDRRRLVRFERGAGDQGWPLSIIAELDDISAAAGVSQIQQLIGVDRSCLCRVLALADRDRLVTIDLKVPERSSSVAPPASATKTDLKNTLTFIKSQSRIYGDTALTVDKSAGGTTNVFLSRGGESSSISGCEVRDCSQPSLSLDGSKIVFIEAQS